jgi:hypothetical protein
VAVACQNPLISQRLRHVDAQHHPDLPAAPVAPPIPSTCCTSTMVMLTARATLCWPVPAAVHATCNGTLHRLPGVPPSVATRPRRAPARGAFRDHPLASTTEHLGGMGGSRGSSTLNDTPPQSKKPRETHCDSGYSASPGATRDVHSRVHFTRDQHHDVAMCGDHILECRRHPDERWHGAIAHAIPGAKMRRRPSPCLVAGKSSLPPILLGTKNEDRHARDMAASGLPNDCTRRRPRGLDRAAPRPICRAGCDGTRPG